MKCVHFILFKVFHIQYHFLPSKGSHYLKQDCEDWVKSLEPGTSTAAKMLLRHSFPWTLIQAVPARLWQQQPAKATRVCVILCDNQCN